MNDCVEAVQQSVNAFDNMMASEEFKRYERMRFDAECIRASALYNARLEEREKWLAVIAEKDARIAERDALIAEKDSRIAELKAQIAKYENK
jgi:hypothetical protein